MLLGPLSSAGSLGQLTAFSSPPLPRRYEVQLKEKFFLEGHGNLMDFPHWKRKPNLARDQYLRQLDLDAPRQPSAQASKQDGATPVAPPTSKPESQAAPPQQQQEGKSPRQPSRGSHIKLEPADLTGPSPTKIQIPLSTVSPSITATPPKSSPPKTLHLPSPSPRPSTRSHASLSVVYESSHEDIVMRARQEAEVMRAIAELRREGLWSASRLPKVMEPARRKTQWDYLLEEMQWLAADFANERRWKINAAKKVGVASEPRL